MDLRYACEVCDRNLIRRDSDNVTIPSVEIVHVEDTAA